jgi:DNA-binding Lrp family transcriptional regulator
LLVGSGRRPRLGTVGAYALLVARRVLAADEQQGTQRPGERQGDLEQELAAVSVGEHAGGQQQRGQGQGALFLRGLPGSRRVVQISAHSILHDFTPGAWQGISSALSADQLAALSAAGTTPSGNPAVLAGNHPVEDLAQYEPLLAELARDGRASHATIAAAIHWHESTVRRRIDELRQAGLLYFEVDLDNRVLGINVDVMLWLSVEPARLDETGRALAAHPEIPFAAATTGPTNLVATALFRDTEHLYQYLTGELAVLPGVSSMQTAPIIRTLKRTGSVH